MTLIQDEQHGITLVDTGLPGSEQQILDALKDLNIRPKDINNIVITHGDMDHAGSARVLQEKTGAQLWSSAVEALYISGEKAFYKPLTEDFLIQLPPDVAQQLREGIPPVKIENELIADACLPFARNAQVIATPGHTPGHVSLFFPEAKTLIGGDAVMADGEQLIFPRFSLDNRMALESIRHLASLAPWVLIAQHGGVLTHDVPEKLQRLAAAGIPLSG